MGLSFSGNMCKDRMCDHLGNNVHVYFVPFAQNNDYLFDCSNVIDIQNHARQCELDLEKSWVVKDYYFMLAPTLYGVVSTYVWKAYRYHLHNKKLKLS